MTEIHALKHEFVEYLPETLDQGVLYVSVPFATAAHTCCCGCGREVVTPFSPTDWQMTFDGESISLKPSIGNWNFDCQSHYWVERNRIRWAPRWTRRQIDVGRARDAFAKTQPSGLRQASEASEKTSGLRQRLRDKLRRRNS